MPTYKRPDLIRRAIGSILSQSYQDFEIVVVDDSPDTLTKEAVVAIGDARIRYVKPPERLGFIEAKNEGVREAAPRSRYVAFCDDDDEYLPGFLEKTTTLLDQNPHLMAVVTDNEMRQQGGLVIKRYPCEDKKFWRVSIGNGCVVRKGVFTKLNIWYDTAMPFEDLDFGVRLTKDYPWGAIHDVLRIYYGYPAQKGDSLTTAFTKETPVEKLEAFVKKNLALYQAAGPEALAWIYGITGKHLMRAGHRKIGLGYLWKSLVLNPKPSSFIYYGIALIAPWMFYSLTLLIWKNRILGMFKQ